MARYLHTQGISAAVVDLIKAAKQRLYLVSPYLKLSDTLRDLLRDKNEEQVLTHIIFGKQELAPAEMEFLQALKHVKLFFYKNLHAKCCLNDSHMIIASMNLYEFSQQTNREMGVLIDRAIEGDATVYEHAWSDIQSIQRNSEEFRYVRVTADAPRKSESRVRDNVGDDDEIGYCIRCSAEVELEPARPYCRNCYRQWKAGGADEAYREAHCHLCGNTHSASLLKPACPACYRANKRMFAAQ